MYDTEGAKGVTTRLVRRDGELRLRLLRDRHRRLSRSPEPRVLRRESVRLEGRLHRHRHVVLRRVVGSGLGSGDAHRRRRMDGGDPHSVQPASLLARLRADVGTCRCDASSSGNNEQDQWALWGKTEAGGPARFGHLEGLRIPRVARRHLELLPYVVSKSSSRRATRRAIRSTRTAGRRCAPGSISRIG